MSPLPSVLDIEDALERVRAEADADVDEEIDSIRDRLRRLSDDRTVDREGMLDDIDNTLLTLEERTEGEAERDVRAARNRIEIYRDARGEGEQSLLVIDSGARTTDSDESDGDDVVSATVVNDGAARDVRLLVTFYDDDDDPVGEAASPEVRVDRGEQRTIEFAPDVPLNAAYYRLAAREATDDASAEDARTE